MERHKTSRPLNRIVNTTREPRGQIAGIVDYEAALEDRN